MLPWMAYALRKLSAIRVQVPYPLGLGEFSRAVFAAGVQHSSHRAFGVCVEAQVRVLGYGGKPVADLKPWIR